MKIAFLTVVLVIFFGGVTLGQNDFNITKNSAGGVRLGMSVAQARKELKGCSFKRSSDGEGITLIAITCSRKHIITVFAGEEDFDAPINERAKIEFIEVWDRRFQTADGIHPEMLVREVEKRLGRVKEIMLSEIESREFVTFSRRPKSISFRIYGGIYVPKKRTTTRYQRGTKLFSIQASD